MMPRTCMEVKESKNCIVKFHSSDECYIQLEWEDTADSYISLLLKLMVHYPV